MSTKTFLKYVAILVVIGLTLGPYGRYLAQRVAIDGGIAESSIQYSTSGKERFIGLIERICQHNGLKPGEYELFISEDKNIGRVYLEVKYTASFKILFFPVSKETILRTEFDFVDI